MKMLYIASNPTNAGDLNLLLEIHELQRSFTNALGAPSSCEFLPALKVEDLPRVLRESNPDILHFAAHGVDGSLSLADATGRSVALTAELLVKFLPTKRQPRIVYLNACNSHATARALVESAHVKIAIGSTSPITNRTARSAAVVFYDSLLAGNTVGVAFESCKGMIELTGRNEASAEIFKGTGIDLSTEVMHRAPAIIARFDSGKPTPGGDGHYRVNLGLLGCPPTTVQAVFFTDDESFVTDPDSLEEDLCCVLRIAPTDGIIWMDDEYWKAKGDLRLFAVGVTADGGCFTVASTLCEAIERHYRNLPEARLRAAVEVAIKNLTSNNEQPTGGMPRLKSRK